MALWLILALTYALAHSIVPSIDRYILRGKNIDPLTFSTLRFIANASIAITITLLFSSISISYEPSFWIYVLAIAGLYALSATGYFSAIKYEDISKMIPLGQSITTFLSFILSVTLLAEVTKSFDILGVGGIIAGSYMILSEGKLLNKKMKIKISKGMMFILLWSVSLALFGVISKPALDIISPFVLNVFLYSLVAIYLVTLNFLTNRKNMAESAKMLLSSRKTLLLTIASSLSATVGTLLLLMALSIGNAHEVLTVSRSTPLFAVLFGGLALKERQWKTRLAGAILIVLGIYGIYV